MNNDDDSDLLVPDLDDVEVNEDAEPLDANTDHTGPDDHEGSEG